LFPIFGHVGVAAAIAASGWVGATLLGVVLWRRGRLGLDHDAARRLPGIAAAAIVMGAAIFGLRELSAALLPAGGPLLRSAALVLTVAIGVAVYLASLETLGVARLHDLVRAVRHRL
jgi:putative peptidoglycan lipid II flippase